MSKIKVIRGDLVKLAQQGNFDVVVHGTNCFCSINPKSLSARVRQAWPPVYYADCQTSRGDQDKLGTFTRAIGHLPSGNIAVVNAYIMFEKQTKRNIETVNYAALRECLKNIAKMYAGQRIGMPLIGAGWNGGGDEDTCCDVIEETMENCLVTIVKEPDDYETKPRTN
jgi:O-acetyl-ADP-ribose deacetylase (regulator of RNase III)